MPAFSEGGQARDFTLAGTRDGPLTLLEVFKRRGCLPRLLPTGLQPVCADELNLLQEVADEPCRLGAQVIGVSVDGTHNAAGIGQGEPNHVSAGGRLPPKERGGREVRRDVTGGIAERALSIVDSRGAVRYSFVSELTGNPGVDALLGKLEELQGQER